MTARAISTLLGVVLAWLVLGASSAQAGTYEVPACREAGGASGGWTFFNTNSAAFETGASCNGGSSVYDGLYSRDQVVNPSFGKPDDRVGISFDAPAGTTITRLSYSRFIEIVDDNWAAGLSVIGGPAAGRHDDCTPGGFSCSVGTRGGGTPRVLSGIRAERLELGIYCEPTFGYANCPTGDTISSGPKHFVSAVLYGARVLVEDLVAPSVQTPSGPGGWVRGAVGVGVGGADGQSGVRRLEVMQGSSVRGSSTLGCVAAQPVPCPLGPQAAVLSVDTALLGDGLVELRSRAIDAGGELADSSGVLVLRVDNAPPAAPVVSAAGANGGWSTRTSDEVVVDVGLEAGRAPIASVQLERCEPGGGCAVSTVAAGAGGSQQRLTVSGLAEGVTRLRARLIDEAANVGAWSAELVERSDRTAPGLVSVEDVPAGWTRTAPTVNVVGAGDLVSGTERSELELCTVGGGCVVRSGGAPPASVATAVGEGEYDLRARQIDRAGLTGEWGPVRRLRVDTTAPVASVGAVAGSVAAGTVFNVTVDGQDARSGVASVTLEVEENGAWRATSSPVTARAGVRYRFRSRVVDVAGNEAESSPTSLVSVTVSQPGPGDSGAPGPGGSGPGGAGAQPRVLKLTARTTRRAATGSVRVWVTGTTQARTGRVRLHVTVGRWSKLVSVLLRRGAFSASVTIADRSRRARTARVAAYVVGSKARAVVRRASVRRR